MFIVTSEKIISRIKKSYFYSMKKIMMLLVASLAISCTSKVNDSDIAKLNGYWEIENVILADGSKKEYKINETIDYFKVDDKGGFRKKVMPQFDGTYLENGDAEKIEIDFQDGKAHLNYSTSYAKWTEEIVSISDEKLVLKSQDIEYHYKKPIPFSKK